MTKLYFHVGNSPDTGTLPSTIQSALGAAAASSDGPAVNHAMDTTIGTTETSQALTSTAVVTAQNLYVTRFCTAPMNITSLAADTWNFVFSAKAAASNANWPITNATANLALNITLYVWRPSNGTKIATILDGNSNANFGSTNTDGAVQLSFSGTFNGAAVSFASQDIICMEVYFRVTQGSAVTRIDTFYYDGNTETNNNGTTTTSQASHIESPNNTITFGSSTAVVYPRFFSSVQQRPSLMTPILGNVPPVFSTYPIRQSLSNTHRLKASSPHP